MLCFADIYDVAFGACDGVDDVFVLDGDFLRNGAGGGGVLVPDDHQLLEVALVRRGGASSGRGEAGPHQDILQVPVPPVRRYDFMVVECGVVVLCVCECVFQFGVYVYDVL